MSRRRQALREAPPMLYWNHSQNKVWYQSRSEKALGCILLLPPSDSSRILRKDHVDSLSWWGLPRRFFLNSNRFLQVLDQNPKFNFLRGRKASNLPMKTH